MPILCPFCCNNSCDVQCSCDSQETASVVHLYADARLHDIQSVPWSKVLKTSDTRWYKCSKVSISNWWTDPSQSFQILSAFRSPKLSKSSLLFSETKARRRDVETWLEGLAGLGGGVTSLTIPPGTDNISMCLRVSISSPSFQKDLLSWFNDSNYNDKLIRYDKSEDCQSDVVIVIIVITYDHLTQLRPTASNCVLGMSGPGWFELLLHGLDASSSMAHHSLGAPGQLRGVDCVEKTMDLDKRIVDFLVQIKWIQ